MRIERITYSTSRQISEVFWEKIGVEATLGEGDDPETELITLKRKVEDVQKKFNEPRLYPINEVLGTTHFDKTSMGISIADIESCPDLTALESHRLLVVKDKQLKEAYDNKFEQLKNK